jgi:miniconductance mechanosensitive channel
LIRKLEIDAYNTTHKIDKSIAINGRNLTNLGLFRKYTEYLFHYPELNKDMLMLCRRQSTAHGVPLEVYAFSHDKRFENYTLCLIFSITSFSVRYFDLEILNWVWIPT